MKKKFQLQNSVPSTMIKFILGTICIAVVSANNPPSGGSLEDLIHDIFTPPPDLSKGNDNGYNQPGVIGQPGAIGQPGPVQTGPVKPQQPPIEVNVSDAYRHMNLSIA